MNQCYDWDKNSGLKPFSADNIFVVNFDNIDKLKTTKNKLILIDRAELVLGKEDIEFINKDKSNRYIIFARKPLGIELSPNYFGEFVRINGEIQVKYAFDEIGWF